VTEVVNSKNAIPIRPSDERWAHIAEEHVELAGMRADVLGTVATPSAIYQGGAGELLAAHEVQAGKWLVVVYRESSRDGFYNHSVPHAQNAVSGEEKKAVALTEIEQYLKLLPNVKQSPQGSVWMSYDREADVLYVNYKKPSPATDSELTDDDVIVRYDGEVVVGFTILHASTR
jgi:uncharacterized protein YuzE